MDSSELAAAAVASLTAALAGASASAVVDHGGTALAALVRGGLGRSPRGQAALTALEADPGDTGARTDAEAALAEELTTDPDLRSRLSVILDSSARSYRDTVVITGSRVTRSPISLGPLTINNTAGGRALAGVVIVLALALLALALYGTRELLVTDDGPSRSAASPQASTPNDPGRSTDDTAGEGGGHMLTPAQTELAMPRPEDVPDNWTLFDRDEALNRPGGCGANYVEYEVDGGMKDKNVKVARFLVASCPSAAAAGALLSQPPVPENPLDALGSSPTDLRLPKLGDESTGRAYDKDSSRTIVISIREGNAFVRLTYEFLSDSKADENEALTRARMAHDRLKSVRQGSLKP